MNLVKDPAGKILSSREEFLAIIKMLVHGKCGDGDARTRLFEMAEDMMKMNGGSIRIGPATFKKGVLGIRHEGITKSEILNGTLEAYLADDQP